MPPASNEPDPAPPPQQRPLPSTSAFMRLLRLWFGISDRVRPFPYMASGLSLGLFKYAVEAFTITASTSTIYWPWDFINPIFSFRIQTLHGSPEWIPWAMFLWTLPFLWIAVTMSVRRAADTGESPWLGLLVLIPFVNYVFMLWACLARSLDENHWLPVVFPQNRATQRRQDPRKVAALAVGCSLIVGGLMLTSSVYLFATYGTTLFLGAPMLMGATAGYIVNRDRPSSYAASAGIGLTAVFFGGCALLLFAIEGAICVAMAFPLMLPIGAMGGVMGKAIADSTRRPAIELLGAILVLPLLAGVESIGVRSNEYMVLTAVEINAPPEVVWNHVVDFPDITEPEPWYFSWGIASPRRARIVGRGVGAIRYCEFSTGDFVEPIQQWDEPRRLAFNVTEQPDPMVELSPYRHVHPPHMDHYLRSTHGEFHLVPLPQGRTRLEGRTWYKFDMFPQAYWTLWSDFLIHRIHERVLVHIQHISEAKD